jgi:hypothetical protein
VLPNGSVRGISGGAAEPFRVDIGEHQPGVGDMVGRLATNMNHL